MDVIYNRYKDEIVDPWIKSLEEEGKKSLVGTIELSSKVAKELVTSALKREDNRYERELEESPSLWMWERCNILSPCTETSWRPRRH